MVNREVARLEARFPEKAELVPRWHGHQGRCRALVSTILLLFNFAAKLCSSEGLGSCPVCKTFKSTTAQVETRGGGGGNSGLIYTPTGASWVGGVGVGGGEGGGQSEEKTSRVAKTEALESDRPRICIPACASPCLCEFQGFPSRV